MNVGFKTDVGRKRLINQDNFFVSCHNDFPLLIIADGMGGHKAGEVASKMSIDIIREDLLSFKEDLQDIDSVKRKIKSSIEDANTKIYLKSLEKDFEGMGTTTIVSYLIGNKAIIGHVGDSRAYILRSGELIQLTEDHSFVNQLVKSGDISKEEAFNHPRKNMITRAVGSSSIIEIDLLEVDLVEGDIFILVTDGVFNMVDDKEIIKSFLGNESLQKTCEEIIAKANNNGGKDNSTIVAVKYSKEVSVC